MWKSFSALLLVCFSVAPTAAGAISFEARDFDALAREADQVVIGTVTAKSSRRTGVREIVTDYRFEQLQIVKGSVPGSSLTLTMLGGAVGTDSLTVAGAPTFKRGVRYLVFVSGNGSVMFPLVGGPQGIFQMRKDAASGISRVHDYAGQPVTRLPKRAGKAGADAVATSELMTESSFVEAIRASNAMVSETKNDY